MTILSETKRRPPRRVFFARRVDFFFLHADADQPTNPPLPPLTRAGRATTTELRYVAVSFKPQTAGASALICFMFRACEGRKTEEEREPAKSLRNGVHIANAVVWGPV